MVGKTIEENRALVTIIIPHIGQSDILYACLRSLKGEKKTAFRVLIVDNGSDLSYEKVGEILSDYQIVRNDRNLGFAGGCNVGLRQVQTRYALLLNNDTEVGENWLQPLVACMEDHPDAAACQPKILSMRFPGKFDYAGGMGGLIDRYGYPFTIGRIFDYLETDNGQYEGRFRIFWASGTAMMIRTAVLRESGFLDEDFFAHMEEIDLNWRFHLLGYKVLSDSKSVVYHYSGYSLGHEAHRKMYLNHRNNWVMLLKNYSPETLLWLIPSRTIFDGITLLISITKLDFKRSWAVFRAWVFVLLHLTKIFQKHREVQSIRKISDKVILSQMYSRSIVIDYFLRGVRRVSDLEGCPTWSE